MSKLGGISTSTAPRYLSASEADIYGITSVSIMVGEKFGWMTERSPVTLLREEKEKAVGQSCSLTCQVTAMRGYLMHC